MEQRQSGITVSTTFLLMIKSIFVNISVIIKLVLSRYKRVLNY